MVYETEQQRSQISWKVSVYISFFVKVNSVMKKAEITPPDTGEESQVTLRQRCESVKVNMTLM